MIILRIIRTLTYIGEGSIRKAKLYSLEAGIVGLGVRDTSTTDERQDHPTCRCQLVREAVCTALGDIFSHTDSPEHVEAVLRCAQNQPGHLRMPVCFLYVLLPLVDEE